MLPGEEGFKGSGSHKWILGNSAGARTSTEGSSANEDSKEQGSQGQRAWPDETGGARSLLAAVGRWWQGLVGREREVWEGEGGQGGEGMVTPWSHPRSLLASVGGVGKGAGMEAEGGTEGEAEVDEGGRGPEGGWEGWGQHLGREASLDWQGVLAMGATAGLQVSHTVTMTHKLALGFK